MAKANPVLDGAGTSGWPYEKMNFDIISLKA